MPVTVIRITVHDDAKTKDLDELQSSRPLANLHQNQPNNGDPSTNSNEIVTLHKIQNHASRLYIECIEKYTFIKLLLGGILLSMIISLSMSHGNIHALSSSEHN